MQISSSGLVTAFFFLTITIAEKVKIFGTTVPKLEIDRSDAVGAKLTRVSDGQNDNVAYKRRSIAFCVRFVTCQFSRKTRVKSESWNNMVVSVERWWDVGQTKRNEHHVFNLRVRWPGTKLFFGNNSDPLAFR